MIATLLLLAGGLVLSVGGQGLLANDVKKQMREGGGGGGGGKAASNAQRRALEDWIAWLQPARDYNATLWKQQHGRTSQPGTFFAHYSKELSRVYKSAGGVVNFVMVGACDGTHDKTIRERFLADSHWEAVFVEPVKINFADLTAYLHEQKVMDRSHLIKAAATDACTSATTKIKFPVYETRSPNAPHWLRREIGAVLTPDEMSGKKALPRNWNSEEVRCVTAKDILTDWTNATRASLLAASGGSLRKYKKGPDAGKEMRRRPHVLKIDAEGHDYQVLMGFVQESVPANELPLLISFEAKSIKPQFNQTVAWLQSRGYVVSERADDGQITNDGFAMLTGQRVKGSRGRKTQSR